MNYTESEKHFMECEKESSNMRECIVLSAESRCKNRIKTALDQHKKHLSQLKEQLINQWQLEEENSRNLLSKSLKTILEEFKSEVELTL